MRFKIRAIALYSFLFAVIVSQGQEYTTEIVYPDVIFSEDAGRSTTFYGEKRYSDDVLAEFKVINDGQTISRTIRNYDWNMEVSTGFDETGGVSHISITPFILKENRDISEDTWDVDE